MAAQGAMPRPLNDSFQQTPQMKILVPVKRVIDYNVKARVKPDQSGVDLSNVKMSMNPFCEIAVEEAVRQKEKGVADEVVVVSIGPIQAQETIRTALAMGGDRGILIQTDADPEPLEVAKLLKAVTEAEQPSLILMGKQAIDGDNNAVGQMLSGPAGLAAGDLRLEGRDLRRDGAGDPRGGRRPADPRDSTCRRWSPRTCASTSRATPRCPTS